MKQQPHTNERVSIRGLFGRVMTRVLLAWMGLTVISLLAVLALAPELTWPTTMIAVLSGVISICALIPGMSLGTPEMMVECQLSRHQRIKRSGLFMVGALAAMIIRVVGTVALLVVCRYQMGLPLETIVFFVCGWYVALTAVEVFWLARNATVLDAVAPELPLAASDALVDGTDF